MGVLRRLTNVNIGYLPSTGFTSGEKTRHPSLGPTLTPRQVPGKDEIVGTGCSTPWGRSDTFTWFWERCTEAHPRDPTTQGLRGHPRTATVEGGSSRRLSSPLDGRRNLSRSDIE